MDELIVRENNLPATLEDLSKFVLVGRDKLNAVRAEISALDNLNLAKEVRDQKLAEGQENENPEIETPKPKLEVAAEMGFNKNQVSQFQQLADNPDAVQKAIAVAEDNGEIP